MPIPAASFMVMCCTASSACGPVMRMSPMWLTSKTPTPLRTARCSFISPPTEGYSTGMSQPLKSTIFAPIWRWTAFSAVLRTGAATGVSDDNSEILWRTEHAFEVGPTLNGNTCDFRRSTKGQTRAKTRLPHWEILPNNHFHFLSVVQNLDGYESTIRFGFLLALRATRITDHNPTAFSR